MEEVYSAIQTKNQSLMSAFQRGDAAGVAAVYGEDAVLMPPNTQMFRGRAAIQAFWQQGISLGFRDLHLEPLEVEAREDVAYEIGRFQRRIESVRGDTITQGGKYVTLWRRTANGWTPERDIWNATGPVSVDEVVRPVIRNTAAVSEPVAAPEPIAYDAEPAESMTQEVVDVEEPPAEPAAEPSYGQYVDDDSERMPLE